MAAGCHSRFRGRYSVPFRGATVEPLVSRSRGRYWQPAQTTYITQVWPILIDIGHLDANYTGYVVDFPQMVPYSAPMIDSLIR